MTIIVIFFSSLELSKHLKWNWTLYIYEIYIQEEIEDKNKIKNEQVVKSSYLRCAWRNDVITTPALLEYCIKWSFCMDGRCDEMVLNETPPTDPRGVYIDVDMSSSLSEKRLLCGKKWRKKNVKHMAWNS